MSFVGDLLGDIVNPILGKPDPNYQEDAIKSSTDAANQAATMSGDYYTKTAPIRTGLIDRLTNFMNGNLDPTASAMYSPIKTSAENQYQTGRENLMSELPQGGALFEGLANLEGQKADTTSNLIAALVKDEYNKAYAMGQGSQQVAASGITDAANASSGAANALANQQQAGAAGTANAVGLINAILKFLA
jgi:hypothetical protein